MLTVIMMVIFLYLIFGVMIGIPLAILKIIWNILMYMFGKRS